MVKNSGGNRAKKQGSKYQNTDFRKTTRFSKHPDEIYAAVIKEYGGGRALVKCIDGEDRILIIRNKFKGKSKSQNYIKSGVWVLAGKRNWECLKPSSKENCDLLEVYSIEDAAFLRTNVDACWELLSGTGTICDEDNIETDNTRYINDNPSTFTDIREEEKYDEHDEHDENNEKYEKCEKCDEDDENYIDNI